MRHFYSSFIITAIGLAAAFFLGGVGAIYICFLLALLEVSLSFDNAVINAKVLETMPPVWQRRFIIFGIPIAVFGMRLVFPLLIVGIASGAGFVEAFFLAVKNPQEYHALLKSCERQIFVFGGAFLVMVFFEWFFEARSVVWVKFFESNPLVNALKRSKNIALLCATLIGLCVVWLTQDVSLAMSYFAALALHSLISLFSDIFSPALAQANHSNATQKVATNGLAGFLYLEVLDASFSFDGVIGAFALTGDIFIIAIGLGVGAMFVRSLTIFLVEKKTLAKFRFLEHGAHYAILILGGIMLLKIHFHISEMLTGTIGFGLILAAFLHSIYSQKTHEKVAKESENGSDQI